MLNNILPKLRTTSQHRIIHLALKVIGNSFGLYRTIHTLNNQVSSFVPAHVAQHHFCGEDQGAGVYLVLTSILGCSTVGSFKQGNSVAEVGSRCDAIPPTCAASASDK